MTFKTAQMTDTHLYAESSVEPRDIRNAFMRAAIAECAGNGVDFIVNTGDFCTANDNGIGLREFFGQDLRWGGFLNLVADLDFKPEVVEENAETIVERNGNGAILRRFKHKTTTPEHVGYRVQEGAD